MFKKPKYRNKYEEILEKLDTIDIYSFYLRVNIRKIPFKIKSPLRKQENNPSFNLYFYNNTILWKDFTLNESGNVYTLVSKMYNLSYNEAINKIYNDMILQNFVNTNRQIYGVNKTILTNNQSKVELTPYLFNKFIPKSYWDYWKQYKVITKDILNKNRVNAVKYVYYNDYLYAKYTANDIVILYTEYRKNKSKAYRKIYRPFNKEKKWISNFRGDSKWLIHGLGSINKNTNYIIITKSNKDKMVLEGLNYNAINVQNEGITIPLKIVNYLESIYKFIFVLYDNDYNKKENWGQRSAKLLIKEHSNFINIKISNKYKCTDISEFILKYDEVKTKILLDSLLNKYLISK